MTTRALAAVLSVAALALAGCDPAGRVPATVVVAALGEAACADFCAAAIGAAIYRVGDTVPIGPVRTVPCGEPLTFGPLPAGIRVQVRGWAADAESRRRLEGVSDEATVVADGAIDLVVRLVPVARPVVTSVLPDPLLPWESDVFVQVRGERFGTGGGASTVELDGTALALQEAGWEADAIRVRVPRGSAGSSVVVRACGVESDPFPMRVLARAPGVRSFDVGGCPGISVRAVAAVSGTADLLVAGSCTSGAAGALERLDVAACAIAAAEHRDLPAVPVSVAADAGFAYVAMEDGGVLRLPLGDAPGEPTAADPPWPGPAGPLAIAALGGAAWVVAGRDEGARLCRVDASGHADVALEGGLLPRDAVAAGGRLLVAGVAGVAGEPALVAYVPGSEAQVTWPLPGCAEPGHVTAGADGRFAVVACGAAAASVVPLEGDRSTALVGLAPSGAGGGLAIDQAGDLAFGWSGSGVLSALALAPTSGGVAVSPARIGALVVGKAKGPLASGLPDGRGVVVFGNGATLALVTPLSGRPPCTGGATQ